MNEIEKVLTRIKLLIYLVIFWIETAFTVWIVTVTTIDPQHTYLSGIILGFVLTLIWILTIKLWNEKVFKELNRIIVKSKINE